MTYQIIKTFKYVLRCIIATFLLWEDLQMQLCD
jgi:hypothetical protein